jgi:hypothetical protein
MHSYNWNPSGRSRAGTFPVGNLERYSEPTPPLLASTFIGHTSTYSTSSLESCQCLEGAGRSSKSLLV